MLFTKKTKLFTEISFSNVRGTLPAKTVQRLSTFLNKDVRLERRNYQFSVSKYTTGFEDKTEEERELESYRRYSAYVDAHEQAIDGDYRHVVDLELFVSTFPEVPFQVLRQVYVRTR